ncbi:hypothetical protein GOHSU_02_00120 [Gordonia hirsuta DSM 44140 = NBRC 16056]|uniref:Uncharacterized protein n=1 Tax=Gordonia hirsuta DSM 44140 = NBRC 16056 TaxID=1121927 RepID=L7L4J6_9ACTN|nr:hypothetical protein [Gordonia hirsuta]GAC55869.1 hypothetical protein GOHSU_02_00120 [Gordonia hirsuta DSM 44140 = NBRC 16056]
MTLLDDRPATRRRRSTQAPPSDLRSAPGRTRTRRPAQTAAEPVVRQRRPRRSGDRPVPSAPSGVFTGLANVPFIVPVVLLVIGALGMTLYLSTKAAQDSYALESVRQEHRLLTERRNDLKRTADSGDSAPELADKAARLGMVPATDPAHLVVGVDGKGRLRGQLTPAEGRRLGSLNPAPDPVQQIDVSKVDDSGGLGGTPPPPATPQPEKPQPQTPGAEGPQSQDRPGSPQTPAAPETTGQTAPASPTVTAPEATTPKPEPNVLPRSAATPNRNNPSTR